MLTEVDSYLRKVKSHLHLDSATESRVVRELYSHFQEKISDLRGQGQSESEAERLAIQAFGEARDVARRMYEAHSAGSWTDAFLVAQPHLIAAALFATHFWRYPAALIAASGTVGLITLLTVRRGRPNWLPTWIGYSLVPLIVAAYFSRGMLLRAAAYLLQGRGSPPPVWTLALLCALYGLTVWMFLRNLLHSARRDWIFASLMICPIPALGSWLVRMDQISGLPGEYGPIVLIQWDTVLSAVVLVLGASAVLTVRLRRRLLKAGTILVSGSTGAAVVIQTLWSDLHFFQLTAASLLILLFLLVPALIEAMVGGVPHGQGGPA